LYIYIYVYIYVYTVLKGRLTLAKAEPPKTGGASDIGNPNDGSSTSDLKSSSSGCTQMTSVQVPRRVREKVKDVAPRLYEQDKLAETCGETFSSLHVARQVALERGVIDSEFAFAFACAFACGRGGTKNGPRRTRRGRGGT
jgi:hypothetical protein